MLTGLFQVCAKQKCSSVSHLFDIILTIHMSKYMRFFLSKLKVFLCFFFFVVFFCLFFFVNLDKQTLGTGALRKKNYSLFLD